MEDEDRYLEEHRDDPGEWEEKVERRPGQVGSIVFSVRFSRDEIASIRQAAARVGERTSEFIRMAAFKRLHEDVAISLDMVTGHPSGGDFRFTKPGPNTEAATLFDYVPAA